MLDDRVPSEMAPETPGLPIPAPRFTNSTIENKNTDSPPNYLQMSPKSGTVRYSSGTSGSSQNYNPSDYLRPDSPTIAKNLDSSPKHRFKHTNKKQEMPEQIPMLTRNGAQANNSDSEPETAPVPNSRKKANEDAAVEYTNVMQSNDNYVNVPSNIASTRFNSKDPKKDAFSNPSYVTPTSFKTVNERVN